MKLFNAFVTLLLLFCFSTLKTVAQSSDENKVRAVIQKGEDAWNAHDYSFSGKYDLFAENAVLVNPVGMYWKNRPEIIKGVQTFGPIMFKNTSVKYHIKDINFLASTVAIVIVHSVERVEQDYNLPDGTKGGSKGDVTEGMFTYTLAKTNQGWKITSLHITTINSNAAASNPVKDK